MTTMVEEVRTDLSASQVLRMIAYTEFKPFTKQDWMAFSGCTSDHPRIGVSGVYTIILDGDEVNVIHERDPYGGQSLSMVRN